MKGGRDEGIYITYIPSPLPPFHPFKDEWSGEGEGFTTISMCKSKMSVYKFFLLSGCTLYIHVRTTAGKASFSFLIKMFAKFCLKCILFS
jgi:hypothetical protein